MSGRPQLGQLGAVSERSREGSVAAAEFGAPLPPVAMSEQQARERVAAEQAYYDHCVALSEVFDTVIAARKAKTAPPAFDPISEETFLRSDFGRSASFVASRRAVPAPTPEFSAAEVEQSLDTFIEARNTSRLPAFAPTGEQIPNAYHLNSDPQGLFGGLGMKAQLIENPAKPGEFGLHVIKAYKGGAAAEQGIKARHVITKIGNQSLAEILDEATIDPKKNPADADALIMDLTRGAIGTEVGVTVGAQRRSSRDAESPGGWDKITARDTGQAPTVVITRDLHHSIFEERTTFADHYKWQRQHFDSLAPTLAADPQSLQAYSVAPKEAFWSRMAQQEHAAAQQEMEAQEALRHSHPPAPVSGLPRGGSAHSSEAYTQGVQHGPVALDCMAYHDLVGFTPADAPLGESLEGVRQEETRVATEVFARQYAALQPAERDALMADLRDTSADRSARYQPVTTQVATAVDAEVGLVAEHLLQTLQAEKARAEHRAPSPRAGSRHSRVDEVFDRVLEASEFAQEMVRVGLEEGVGSPHSQQKEVRSPHSRGAHQRGAGAGDRSLDRVSESSVVSGAGQVLGV